MAIDNNILGYYRFRNEDGTWHTESIRTKIQVGDSFEAGMSIPCDPANTDYQNYLEWVAEGNTIEDAE